MMKTSETASTGASAHLPKTYLTPANARHIIPLLSVTLLLLSGGGFQATAGTTVSGTIVNQVWDKNGSPYYVNGNIQVAGLTISNGVTVYFQGNYVFEVQGVLKAYGVTNAPIVFYRPGTGGWQGIYFTYSSLGSEIVGCVVSNSVNSGIRILNAVPIIRECTIAYNSAYNRYGGGVSADIQSGDLVLERCLIANNTVYYTGRDTAGGGGVSASMYGTNRLDLDGCTVSGNAVRSSGGYSWGYGGGVYASGPCIIRNSLITSNYVEGASKAGVVNGCAFGGGVCSSSGGLVVRNSTITGNTANAPDIASPTEYGRGGGIHMFSDSLAISNSMIAYNTVAAVDGADGAGICFGLAVPWSNTSAQGNIVNCTIAYNNRHAVAGSDPSAVSIRNSILYFNASGGLQISGAGITATYSDVQGGLAGVGNINLSPAFRSPNNLRIVAGSPCIDAGNPGAIYNDVAFNGVALSPSLGGSRNDMGAHGGPGALWWGMSPVVTAPPGDQIATNAVTLCVQALGTPPLSYQWLLNGAPIEGATTSCYEKSTIELQDEGWYSVVVSNAWGLATSQPPARVTVTIPHAATATAIVLNGYVVGFTNLWGGWGYTNTPRVRIIGGGGSGAEADAVVSNGMVIAVSILNPGSGYTAPLIVVAPPFVERPTMGVAALSLLSFTNLDVAAVYRLQHWDGDAWLNLGSSVAPASSTLTQYVSGTANSSDYRLAVVPVPRQAFATAQVANGFVIGATLTSGGSGYTTNPAVTIHGVGSNATAIATVDSGSVTNVTITNPGIGYTTGASIVIAPPPAAALWPNEVTQVMELSLEGLSPYDGYQLEFSAASEGAWSNRGLPFVPTSASSTQRIPVSQDTGFFRVRHVP